MKGAIIANRLQQDSQREKQWTRRTNSHRQDQLRTVLQVADAQSLSDWRSQRSLFFERPGSADLTTDLADAVDESEGGGALLQGLAATIHHNKWEKLCNNLLQRSNWSRLGDFAKALCTLPEDVTLMFERYEKENAITLDDGTRLTYYKEFIRAALGAQVLRIDEVHLYLIRERDILFPTGVVITASMMVVLESSNGWQSTIRETTCDRRTAIGIYLDID